MFRLFLCILLALFAFNVPILAWIIWLVFAFICFSFSLNKK